MSLQEERLLELDIFYICPSFCPCRLSQERDDKLLVMFCSEKPIFLVLATQDNCSFSWAQVTLGFSTLMLMELVITERTMLTSAD